MQTRNRTSTPIFIRATLPEQDSQNLGRTNNSTGILTCCPSTTLFSLALGPTKPEMINIAQETLGFRRASFSLALSRYSCQHSHFCSLHSALRQNFTAGQNALLPSFARGFGWLRHFLPHHTLAKDEPSIALH